MAFSPHLKNYKSNTHKVKILKQGRLILSEKRKFPSCDSQERSILTVYGVGSRYPVILSKMLPLLFVHLSLFSNSCLTSQSGREVWVVSTSSYPWFIIFSATIFPRIAWSHAHGSPFLSSALDTISCLPFVRWDREGPTALRRPLHASLWQRHPYIRLSLPQSSEHPLSVEAIVGSEQ